MFQCSKYALFRLTYMLPWSKCSIDWSTQGKLSLASEDIFNVSLAFNAVPCSFVYIDCFTQTILKKALWAFRVQWTRLKNIVQTKHCHWSIRLFQLECVIYIARILCSFHEHSRIMVSLMRREVFCLTFGSFNGLLQSYNHKDKSLALICLTNAQ